jgi:hypothetical protein
MLCDLRGRPVVEKKGGRPRHNPPGEIPHPHYLIDDFKSGGILRLRRGQRKKREAEGALPHSTTHQTNRKTAHRSTIVRIIAKILLSSGTVPVWVDMLFGFVYLVG